MVEADFSGNYLNSDNAIDDSLWVIVSKPKVEEKTGEYGTYNETTMDVESEGKKKIYAPSRESGNKMVVSWGKEMDNWLSKKFNIRHVLKQVKGETKTYIEAYPVVEEKV